MTRLNREGYVKLIEEDIAEMNKHMAEMSLERRHIEDVLRWSITALYGEPVESGHREHWCIRDAIKESKIDVKAIPRDANWTCPRCNQEWIRVEVGWEKVL